MAHLSRLSFLVFMLAAIATSPAQANCAGFGRDPEEVSQQVRQQWQPLQQDDTYFWGRTKMFDTITQDRITLTSAFDKLTGVEKQQVLQVLRVTGSNYRVYTADNRLLSAQYDGCTRSTLLTERDRFNWYLARSPLQRAVTADELRNAGNPSWRTVNVSITPEQEKAQRLTFWSTVGYDKAKQGWWIAWVPEGGYFEVTVKNKDDSNRIQPFLQQAARKFRHLVIATDGTPLDDTQKVPITNPWFRILGKVSAPLGWDAQPCSPQAPFLCVTYKGEPLGSIEFQQWSIEQQPTLKKQLVAAGLQPGKPINYQNATQKAKVFTILRAWVADYHRTIAQDRQAEYGNTIRFVSEPPKEVQVGRFPGLQYGFRGTQTTGDIYERYRGYVAFDGATLFVIATSFDPRAETTTFRKLKDFQNFMPHLTETVKNLRLTGKVQ